MPITRTAMIDDDGSGTTGTILNNAWKQELYGQIDALAAPLWIVPPFDAANYSANVGGPWTVSSGNVTEAYVVLGKTLLFDLLLTNTTLTGATTTALTRKPFGGHKITRQNGGLLISTGAATVGMWTTTVGTPGQINFFRDIVGAAWAAGSITLRCQGFYEIQPT